MIVVTSMKQEEFGTCRILTAVQTLDEALARSPRSSTAAGICGATSTTPHGANTLPKFQ